MLISVLREKDMKTNLILRKAHLNLSILAVTLSVVLLLSAVLCSKLLDRSLGSTVDVLMIVIMGIMVISLLLGFISYFRLKKIDTIEKWTLSLLTFGVGVLAFLFVFELFLKP